MKSKIEQDRITTLYIEKQIKNNTSENNIQIVFIINENNN